VVTRAFRRYISSVAADVNFANPEFEPTDEQLHQLSREAFADVPRNHARALARLREEIEALRAQRLTDAKRQTGTG
jgi:hypothetical protein